MCWFCDVTRIYNPDMIIRQRDQQHQPTLRPRTDSIFNSDAAELFENVATFKSLGLVQIITECMQDKIRSRLNLRKTCYHLSNYLLSSHLLVKTYRLKCMKLNYSIVLHGCETQYFTLSEKHKECLRTGCWGRYLDLRGRKKEEAWET